MNQITEEEIKENLKRIWPILKENNVGVVNITYSAENEEGGIEYIGYMDENGAEHLDGNIRRIPATYNNIHYEFNQTTRTYTRTEELTRLKLSKAIDFISTDLIELHHRDWKQNYGGSGELEFDVKGQRVRLSHKKYYLESHDSDCELMLDDLNPSQSDDIPICD